MGVKSPSKFLSTSYLIRLREDGYCNKERGRGIDYEPSEVDALLHKRSEREHQIKTKKMFKEMDQQEFFLMKSNEQKYCSCCKKVLPFKAFDKDKSKKFFNLRSHCKTCRKDNRSKTMKGEKFRKYLDQIMKENQLNQTTFSDKVKCNHSYVSLILSEKRRPTIAIITKVCNAFQDQKKISEFLMELT